MNVFLMYKDKDFNLNEQLPHNAEELVDDLELDVLLNTMSGGEEIIFDVSKRAILLSLTDADTILYRQDILKDCLNNSGIIEDIYDLTKETIKKEKENFFGFFSKYPDSIIHRSATLLKVFVDSLEKLRKMGEEYFSRFESEGFRKFFSMLSSELTDEYILQIRKVLKELEFDKGILISAQLGKNGQGINYRLCRIKPRKQGIVERFISKTKFTFYINERDESGFKALSELKNKGLNSAANVLAQSVDHILNFFHSLLNEMSFYIGCINLYRKLNELSLNVCFPRPHHKIERVHKFDGLYDISLALTKKQRVVDNSLNADLKRLVIISGANRGGKSTFLRSIGLAQLMMQSGMYVPANSFEANISDGIFTHYKKEEDESLESGKFDEELKRMNRIVDCLRKDSLILLNESFASTNDKEASEIAREVIKAFMDGSVKVFFVTHLYEFVRSFYNEKLDGVMFLRAQRKSDGTRTFKIVEGEPLQTSFAVDLYRKIFDVAAGSLELVSNAS